MVAFVVAAVLIQAPELSITIDRDRAVVGDTLTVTLLIQTQGSDPVEVVTPNLLGLVLVESREQSRVSVAGPVPRRTAVRTLRLVATQAGEGVVGPVAVRHGDLTAQSRTLRVRIALPVVATAETLESTLRTVLLAARPVSADSANVGVSMVVFPDTGLVGAQLELVLIAWFPRQVRTRLSSPPTLELPTVRGAWTYPRPTPAGIALTREIDGVTYDLYVRHHAVFPLTEGRMHVGAGSVAYVVPLTYAFLNRELRSEIRTVPLEVPVLSQPAPPAGLAADGATGSDLRLSVTAASRELPVGAAGQVQVTLEGAGNVALWPEPAVRWPVGLRAYPHRVDVRVNPRDGRIAGAKVFQYLVVADSSGSHRIPETRYGYFDVNAGRHVQLASEPLEFVTPRVAEGAVSRGSQLALLEVRPRLAVRLPVGAWLGLALLPPGLTAAAALLLGRRRRRAPAARRGAEPVGLAALEREFTRLLTAHLDGDEELEGEALAAALRAAGLTAPLATQVARLKGRLQQVAYGPPDSLDLGELESEVGEVIRTLAGGVQRARRSLLVAGVMLVAMAGQLRAAQSPEVLYRAGATRTAYDSLRARAEREPSRPAHWYNLGVAQAALGDAAGARASWLQARRLAPRNGTIRRAWQGTGESGPLTWTAPLTPTEMGIAALAFWWLAWIMLALRRKRAAALVTLTAGIALAAAAGWTQARYRTPIGFTREADVALREAPIPSAAPVTTLARAEPVRVVARHGGWVRGAARGREGWLLASEIAEF